MAEEENERIIIPDEDGNEHVFEVLFTFDVDETEKSYMVVTPVEDEEQHEGEEVEIFAFQYEESSDEPSGFSLHAIESDSEWEMVEEMIATMLDDDETLHVEGEDHQH
ncbi:uncharacterized protein YrzB (UPF0473 family) [Geomicrobium halophilum]|uniref:UPF0473 protein HNR44_000520 n=1 Tax=Geomicrobium halophilum TaxID=549000 RepID=A0A841PQJ1_9BACL|nr:DUF1292 domain-containing protein [Geomicrobium halophilum]MBB6448571.1 uncharacterized protein YrzB (UPF0473 family) [Geomicrobium halophilum]